MLIARTMGGKTGFRSTLCHSMLRHLFTLSPLGTPMETLLAAWAWVLAPPVWPVRVLRGGLCSEPGLAHALGGA